VFDGELRRQKAVLAAADASALVAAVGVAWVAHRPFGDFCPLKPGQWTEIAAGAIGLVTIWIMTGRAVDLYGPRHGRADELLAIVKTACVTWLLALVLGFFAHLEASRLTVAIAFALSIVLVVAGRALTRRSIRYFYAHPDVTIPLVVVGANSIGRYVRDRIVEELSQYEFLGFIDSDPALRGQPGGEFLGGTEQIPIQAAARRNLEAAIVLPGATPDEVKEIIDLCSRNHVRWRVMPWVVQLHAVALKIDLVGTIPLIGPRNSNIEGLNWVIKRGFDIVASTALLVLSAPLLFVSGLMIWLFDGRPLLFRQTRIGIHGKPFELLKFRTMAANCGEHVHREYVKDWIRQNGSANGNSNGQTVYKLDRDPRITPVGAWMRKFSIDELPQLINVLRGEMSLIGPRPALPYELELYQDWHRHRLDAPPGITGLWQVSGRNRLSFDEMVQLDIEYMEDWSLYRDLEILVRTLPAMFAGSGL
jgi:exopolysaccharide biosynthesis polyprenyl glycosylphosphotransferase